jgi:hypothetical protein
VAKKETLKIVENEILENIALYTIASSETDIRLCMLINKVFQINLSLADDMVVKDSNLTLSFKKYSYEEEVEGEKYILLTNQHPSGKYLFPEYKKIDFIFIISSETNRMKYDAQIKNLKENQGISAVFKLDPSSVKSYKRLVL